MDGVRGLPKKILRSIENEFELMVQDHPELAKQLDNSYKRIRKNVLDHIGDVSRQLDEN